jgi:hypothetical protein
LAEEIWNFMEGLETELAGQKFYKIKYNKIKLIFLKLKKKKNPFSDSCVASG